MDSQARDFNQYLYTIEEAGRKDARENAQTHIEETAAEEQRRAGLPARNPDDFAGAAFSGTWFQNSPPLSEINATYYISRVEMMKEVWADRGSPDKAPTGRLGERWQFKGMTARVEKLQRQQRLTHKFESFNHEMFRQVHLLESVLFEMHEPSKEAIEFFWRSQEVEDFISEQYESLKSKGNPAGKVFAEQRSKEAWDLAYVARHLVRVHLRYYLSGLAANPSTEIQKDAATSLAAGPHDRAEEPELGRAAADDGRPTARTRAGRPRIPQKDQKELAKALKPFYPSDWTKPDNLDKICERLQKKGVQTPDGWAGWNRQLVKDMSENKRTVRDAIRYRLEKSPNPASAYLAD